MAKPDKAAPKAEGEALKSVIAQARKKTLNFALLQGKDTMYLETHLRKNPAALRKMAKKKGGGAKAAVGQMNVEGKKIIFSVEEDPPGAFPKLAKKFFMLWGLPNKPKPSLRPQNLRQQPLPPKPIKPRIPQQNC